MFIYTTSATVKVPPLLYNLDRAIRKVVFRWCWKTIQSRRRRRHQVKEIQFVLTFSLSSYSSLYSFPGILHFFFFGTIWPYCIRRRKLSCHAELSGYYQTFAFLLRKWLTFLYLFMVYSYSHSKKKKKCSIIW